MEVSQEYILKYVVERKWTPRRLKLNLKHFGSLNESLMETILDTTQKGNEILNENRIFQLEVSMCVQFFIHTKNLWKKKITDTCEHSVIKDKYIKIH